MEENFYDIIPYSKSAKSCHRLKNQENNFLKDHELIEKFNNQQTRNYVFNLLVRKYQEQVYWHIRRMVVIHEDADDLTQEVFIKIWKSLSSFKKKSQLYTWIYRIATNECLYFLKKKKLKYLLLATNIEREMIKKIESDAYISGDEIQKKLQKALLKLPTKQRLVFNMKYFDNMSYREISQILKTSVGALKASYHLAVKKIKQDLTS